MTRGGGYSRIRPLVGTNGATLLTQLTKTSITTAVAVMLAVSLAACTDRDAVPPSAGAEWAEQIATVKQQASSDLERAILEDNVIERGEYEAAVAEYISCQTAEGVDVTPIQGANSLYTYKYVVDGNDETGKFSPELADSRQAAVDKISEQCSLGTVYLIEPVYGGMVSNPNNDDIYELTASCLVRHGVVPAPFSGDDFREWLASLPENGGAPAASGKSWDIDVETPDFSGCQADPLG